LPFIPPHPQNGTPYHRYTVLLFAQSENAKLSLNEHEIERLDFDVRDFVAEHQLEAKGVSFFRQKWDKSVSKIYEEVLRESFSRFLAFPQSQAWLRWRLSLKRKKLKTDCCFVFSLEQPEPRFGRPPKMDTYTGRPPKYEVV
jgi:large subunit ribosomal protein L35